MTSRSTSVAAATGSSFRTEGEDANQPVEGAPTPETNGSGAAAPGLRPAFSHTYIAERQKAIRRPVITAEGFLRSEHPGYIPVSFSSIWKYRECPRSLYLSILAGLDISGDPADRGTEIHSVSESVQAGEEHVESGTLPLTDVGAYFEMKRKVIEAGATEGAITEKELFVEWEVVPGLKAQMRSFIDWLLIDPVAGTFQFEDYKSGRLIKYEEHEYQRFCYALSVLRNYLDTWKGRGMTTYLQFQDPHRGKVQEFNAEQIEEFGVALEAQVRAMANDNEWKAKPGLKRCMNCDFKTKCDAAQKLLAPFEFEQTITTKQVLKRGSKELENVVEKGALTIKTPTGVTSDDDLKAMAEALFQLDAVRSALYGALKEAVGSRGAPIVVTEDGFAYSGWEKTSKTINDIDGLLATAAELGIPVNEIVRFNAQQGKKYIDKHPVLADMASEYTEKWPVWEFRKLKPAKDGEEEAR